MKKIMFNDRYGLTDAVLKGLKTMTRRVVNFKNDLVLEWSEIPAIEEAWKRNIIEEYAPYKIGEEVAIAQSYHKLNKSGYVAPEWLDHTLEDSAGYKNKMFVKAEYMPHRIRITGIKLERMQDISDDDCLREGIIPVTWRQWHKPELNDFSQQRYTDHHVWTLEKFRESINDPWADSNPDEYLAATAKVAFAVLIFKTLGRKVWEQNPYVFAYEFKLISKTSRLLRFHRNPNLYHLSKL